jgi:hypothetical protein
MRTRAERIADAKEGLARCRAVLRKVRAQLTGDGALIETTLCWQIACSTLRHAIETEKDYQALLRQLWAGGIAGEMRDGA